MVLGSRDSPDRQNDSKSYHVWEFGLAEIGPDFLYVLFIGGLFFLA